MKSRALAPGRLSHSPSCSKQMPLLAALPFQHCHPPAGRLLPAAVAHWHQRLPPAAAAEPVPRPADNAHGLPALRRGCLALCRLRHGLLAPHALQRAACRLGRGLPDLRAHAALPARLAGRRAALPAGPLFQGERRVGAAPALALAAPGDPPPARAQQGSRGTEQEGAKIKALQQTLLRELCSVQQLPPRTEQAMPKRPY